MNAFLGPALVSLSSADNEKMALRSDRGSTVLLVSECRRDLHFASCHMDGDAGRLSWLVDLHDINPAVREEGQEGQASLGEDADAWMQFWGRTRISFCPKCTLSRRCVHIKRRHISPSSSSLLRVWRATDVIPWTRMWGESRRGEQFCKKRKMRREGVRGFLGGGGSGASSGGWGPRVAGMIAVPRPLSPLRPPESDSLCNHKSLAYHGYWDRLSLSRPCLPSCTLTLLANTPSLICISAKGFPIN